MALRDLCARLEACAYDPSCPFYLESAACQSGPDPVTHRTSNVQRPAAGKVYTPEQWAAVLGTEMAILVDGRGVSMGILVEADVVEGGAGVVLTWEYEL